MTREYFSAICLEFTQIAEQGEVGEHVGRDNRDTDGAELTSRVSVQSTCMYNLTDMQACSVH